MTAPIQDTAQTTGTPDPVVEESTEEVFTADIDQQDADDAAEANGQVITEEVPDTQVTEPVAPEGVTADTEGRWRNADGTFASKQPNQKAVDSIKAELAKPVVPENIPKPWTPNIYGTEKPIIPGALYKAGQGIFVPEKEMGRLTALIARGEKYAEFTSSRQESAKRETAMLERMRSDGESFGQILQQTVLNSDWLAMAAADPLTAQREVRLLVQEAALESKEKYGALKATAPVDSGSTLDRYEAEQSLDTLLTEIVGSAPYQGRLSDQDKKLILNDLREQDVPLFYQHPEQGWMLDERPVRLAAKLRAEARQITRPVNPVAPRAPDPTRRNDAAVPKPTAPANKPVVNKKPEDKYKDEPWKNPDLDFQEKRKLFNKAKGFSFPGH